MKKIIKYFLVLLVVFLICGACYFIFEKNKVNDNEKFSEEYSSVTIDNVFVYRSAEDIIKILENGTGIVYLGFPECPWCKAYVKILNEVAKEEGVEKIYYFNILKDRKDNTETYKKIVSLLNENLLYDEEGNRRIYVPDVSFILNGEIKAHDNETSVITDDITPENYWTEEKVTALKEKLRSYIILVDDGMCTSCNK